MALEYKNVHQHYIPASSFRPSICSTSTARRSASSRAMSRSIPCAISRSTWISCVSAVLADRRRVPVHFVNEEASPGLKRGGVLNIVRHRSSSPARPTRSPRHHRRYDGPQHRRQRSHLGGGIAEEGSRRRSPTAISRSQRSLARRRRGLKKPRPKPPPKKKKSE